MGDEQRSYGWIEGDIAYEILEGEDGELHLFSDLIYPWGKRVEHAMPTSDRAYADLLEEILQLAAGGGASGKGYRGE